MRIPPVGSAGAVLDQPAELAVRVLQGTLLVQGERYLEPVQVILGQVDPAIAEILPDVPQDVDLLESDAQRVGVLGCTRVGPVATPG